MNKKAELVITLTYIVFIIFIIGIAVLGFISYTESSEACEKFNGKLSGSGNCVKDGVSYEIESKSPFSLKMQVVRNAVDINGAYFGANK